MAKLTAAQKEFVVTRLALFNSPTETARAVQEEFGVEIDRQQAAYYDPTASGAGPAEKWERLYHSTREEYLEEVSSHEASHKAFRVGQLQEMFFKAKRMGNLPLAAELLEQIAKEKGEKYTNKKALELSGEVDTGGVLVVPDSPDTDDWGEAARRQQGAARGNGDGAGSGG